MMIINKQLFTIYIPALLLVILLAACDEQTFDPFEESNGIYSFYGTVEVNKSPNFVRIRDLSEPFLADSGSFNGAVTFENLETGVVTTLRDTVVNFRGNFTHNFIIDDPIDYNTSYLLRAEKQDGRQSQSIATTPLPSDISYAPVENIDCNTSIDFVFGNVVSPERIDLKITVLHNGQSVSGYLSIFLDELIHDNENNELKIRMSPNNLLVEVFPPNLPDNPNFNPYFLFPTVGCSQLDSDLFQITYIHYGPEWNEGKPLRGSVDTESGDVENGLGFFGGFNSETFSFEIER